MTSKTVTVSLEQLKKWHRDLDACQKVIWLRGGFDPAYCTDAQDCLKEMDAVMAAPEAPRQPEPIYQVSKGLGEWNDVGLLRYTACSFDPEEYEIRVLYTAPLSPDHSGGGAGMVLPEPFAWYTEDYLTDKSATTYDAATAERWKAKGWPVSALYISTQILSSPAVDAAEAFGKGFNLLEQEGGKYRITMAFQNSDDAFAAYRQLAELRKYLDKVKELNQ